MIRIEHPKLKEICKEYSDKIVPAIRQRIDEATVVIALLRKATPITNADVTGKVDVYRAAFKAILSISIPTSTSTYALIHQLNNSREQDTIDARLIRAENLLLQFLDQEIRAIIISPPAKLNALQQKIEAKLGIKDRQHKSISSYLFNYHYFYEKYIAPIGSMLEINVCPYCNRNFIAHIQDPDPNIKKRIVGPTFDHFFHQAKNPLLTLSFYNLIPSCSQCNSNLKGQKNFKLDTHLHPYLHDMGTDAYFDYDLKNIKSKEPHIAFTPTIKIDPLSTKANRKRLEKGTTKDSGSLNVFKLREIYAHHYDTVEEIHEKFDKNSPHYLKSLAGHLKKMDVSEDEFYRYHFGNYFKPKDFKKRPLARLSRDIYNKMSKISPMYPKDGN